MEKNKNDQNPQTTLNDAYYAMNVKQFKIVFSKDKKMSFPLNYSRKYQFKKNW